MPLSDLQIRAIKATGRAVKHADGGGLYLHVTANGSKLWRRPHVKPLSNAAIAYLQKLHAHTGNHAFAFRSHSSPGFGLEEMSAHGFRALASTLLHERSEFSTDAIELSLAHQDRYAVRRANGGRQHWDERVRPA